MSFYVNLYFLYVKYKENLKGKYFDFWRSPLNRYIRGANDVGTSYDIFK